MGVTLDNLFVCIDSLVALSYRVIHHSLLRCGTTCERTFWETHGKSVESGDSIFGLFQFEICSTHFIESLLGIYAVGVLFQQSFQCVYFLLVVVGQTLCQSRTVKRVVACRTVCCNRHLIVSVGIIVLALVEETIGNAVQSIGNSLFVLAHTHIDECSEFSARLGVSFLLEQSVSYAVLCAIVVYSAIYHRHAIAVGCIAVVSFAVKSLTFPVERIGVCSLVVA